MKLNSFQFPDRQITDISTSVPPSLLRFAQQVGADTSELPRRLVVTGRHVVGETIDLPSGFTLELHGAHLVQGGGRVRSVRVEDVRDTSDGKTYMDGYTPRGVNLGDDHAYATPPAVPEDMADITICGVRVRRMALLTRGAFTRLAAENVSS